jgi:hypothetical protein
MGSIRCLDAHVARWFVKNSGQYPDIRETGLFAQRFQFIARVAPAMHHFRNFVFEVAEQASHHRLSFQRQNLVQIRALERQLPSRLKTRPPALKDLNNPESLQVFDHVDGVDLGSLEAFQQRDVMLNVTNRGAIDVDEPGPVVPTAP